MSKMTIENGNKIWRNEAGQYHRVDGPAIIHADGSTRWCIDGEYHRLDGPAYIGSDGYQEWFINGLRHRLDGPAYIGSDGYQEWWVNGLRHRLDGPAIIWTGGKEEWYINNVQINDHATAWIKENNFPDYSIWTDGQKIMFRLAFAGIAS